MRTAIDRRRPPPGCIHHSGRGSQYAAEIYRQLLADQGLIGSMGRRGNPYDNAEAESFVKTLMVEAVYPYGFATFDDVTEQLNTFPASSMSTITAGSIRRPLSEPVTVRGSTHPADWQNSSLITVHPQGRTPRGRATGNGDGEGATCSCR
ncbi:hypothetical protein MES5069_220206 [Mesorhizobium escarrei]|uniref:Integrase catalytic domain-containing protein n=1 Tax=Mesorhizobium escarrei TaxID=666018 RepID=A0ABM9DTP2_9HYPH|nr:hypothetical protein MES5069_220206 [Mesorhizobium escarrei]